MARVHYPSVPSRAANAPSLLQFLDTGTHSYLRLPDNVVPVQYPYKIPLTVVLDNRDTVDRAADIWMVSGTSNVDISKLRRITEAAALHGLHDCNILHDERCGVSRFFCVLVLPG